MIGVFSLDAILEGRDVLHKIRGFAAIHFISTLATRFRARHTLWLKSTPTLLDFLLKFLFAEHISSVSLCHLSSLPQLSGGDEMFPQTIAGGIFDVGGPFEKRGLLLITDRSSVNPSKAL